MQLLIGGMSEIDVADWKANTEYRGYTKDDTVIKQFWEAN
jgi:E3 ubiquitin-protein ligase NEDD4